MTNYVDLPQSGGSSGVSSLNSLVGALNLVAGSGITITPSGSNITIASTGGGSGTVTSVSVTSANGLAGTVTNPTTTPAITLSTTITGILKGNGTAISAATAGTDYVIPSGSITGTASNITASSNSTLTTLTALVLPTSQLSGSISLTTQVSGVLPIANGGTNNSTAYTAGSVIFSNGTSLTQDNSNFFWNDSTFNLGIGVIPATNIAIDATNSTGTSKAIQTTSYGTGSQMPFRGRFARGTAGSPTAAQTGDIFSTLSGRGYGTTGFPAASTGAINIAALATFTDSSMPTSIVFQTTPTGSVTIAQAMSLTSTGLTLAGSVPLVLTGATSGTFTQKAATTTTNYTVTMPSAQGAAATALTNDGAGNLSWTALPTNYFVSTINSNTNAVSPTTYLVDTSGGGVTVTMPAPASGAFIVIKDKTGSFQTNNCILAQHSTEKIEGLAASKALQTNWGAWSIFSDGTDWYMGPF